jgi:hypothetical protein
MKAVDYTRVSDTTQIEGHSLDAQERLYYEYCKTRDGKRLEFTGKKASLPTPMRFPSDPSFAGCLKMPPNINLM